MTELEAVIKAQFPVDFEVRQRAGSLIIRDTTIERGRGYSIKVNQEIRHLEGIVEFEDFAGRLINYAEGQLEREKSIISDLTKKHPQFSGKMIRQSIEELAAPETKREDVWWLRFDYRLSENLQTDYWLFIDILQSLIYLLLPYESEGEFEGQSVEELSKSYERSKVNRALCLAFHGYDCKACGANMRELYKGLKSDFVHVHHLNPISASGLVRPDPINDLVPLCPNCHGVAHLRNPPFSVEEIRNMIEQT
ncbi:HNH endonuclease [Arcticibacter sp. MXS-1]|uniref:HNH endonuclease n=1 Tax=Arcticibacter sp. MXS-1 TaxID=3341726 RepID=UPI0035A8FCF1